MTKSLFSGFCVYKLCATEAKANMYKLCATEPKGKALLVQWHKVNAHVTTEDG